jgi:hypothetical protein
VVTWLENGLEEAHVINSVETAPSEVVGRPAIPLTQLFRRYAEPIALGVALLSIAAIAIIH